MKKLFVVVLVIAAFTANAQSKNEKEVVERTYLLSHTVFGTKDSMTLEDLFAKQATYGHSHGNLQTREEAIAGISKNKSVYTDTAVKILKVIIEKKTAIVRHLFKATETGKDGKVTPLNFTMILVWIKEKGKWRLMGRQAVSIS
ncbi:MAG: nuclear transport factor 2 family protein [Bacteroidota bacterium]|nr:nuclear transport factor 2 family protein [Bacteroidota bacterium]